MLIHNEYLDIPEKTILRNGKIVDNTEYINAHNIGGLKIYDPRIDEGKTPLDNPSKRVKLTFDPLLEYFIKSEDKSRQSRFFYDKDTSILFLKGPMSIKETDELLHIYRYHSQNQDRQAIKKLFVASLAEAESYKKRLYSKEEKEFIQKNRMELETKIRAGWFFFHHSWFLNPIHAIDLGSNLWKQPLIYGFGTPGTPTIYLSMALIFISVGWLIYSKYIHVSNNPMLFFSLSLFLYIELTLIYFIWNPSYHHLLITMLPAILLLLTWLSIFENRLQQNLNKINFSKAMSLCSVAILIFIYAPSVLVFYLEKTQYDKLFTTHVVHEWRFKNASFRSTMDPLIFEQSINLIEKFEQHNYMYLISKYDSLFTVVANKYNAIPTVNIALDMVTIKDIERFYEVVEKNKPKYIFMDMDITRNFHGDIFHINDPFVNGKAAGHYIGSLQRAAMLATMRQLYVKLISSYRPIEQKGLLTAYERKV